MSRWLGKGICQNHKQASHKLIKKLKMGKISQHIRSPHKVFSETKISGLKTPLLPSFTGTLTTTILRFFFCITGQNGVHLVRGISPWSSQVLCIGLVKTSLQVRI